MMKKKGFTLAEVLITLTIIGVVATLTLPSLMTNTQEQQARAGLKKALNTLTEAANMSAAIDGYNYSGLNTREQAADSQSLYSLLMRHAAIDKARSDNEALTGEIGAGDTVLFFRDGTAIAFNAGDAASANAQIKDAEDNIEVGFNVLIDTNGAKGPNLLSNCNGTAQQNPQLTDVDGTYTNDGSVCDVRADRVIKDQFLVRLRGSYAVPEGAAAVWASTH